MISSQANSLRGILRSSSALQKVLQVTSIINFSNEDMNSIFELIFKNMNYVKNRIIFKDHDEEESDLKYIGIVENDIRYVIGKNILSEDVFKSKHNQEVLKISGSMNEYELKSLNGIFIDATNLVHKFLSKILKISDNILILANTIEDSLDRISHELKGERWSGQDVQIIFINDKKDLELNAFLRSFREKVEFESMTHVKILGILDGRWKNRDLPNLIEKCYLMSLSREDFKNLNFLDFVINMMD